MSQSRQGKAERSEHRFTASVLKCVQQKCEQIPSLVYLSGALPDTYQWDKQDADKSAHIFESRKPSCMTSTLPDRKRTSIWMRGWRPRPSRSDRHDKSNPTELPMQAEDTTEGSQRGLSVTDLLLPKAFDPLYGILERFEVRRGHRSLSLPLAEQEDTTPTQMPESCSPSHCAPSSLIFNKPNTCLFLMSQGPRVVARFFSPRLMQMISFLSVRL